MIVYSFDRLKTRLTEIHKWLVAELASIRTGRVSPALLDGVRVEVYNQRLPLKQSGSLTVEDARTLKITLWDKTQLKAVEAALQKANLGATIIPAPDSISVRIVFPELTEEKRKLLTKLVHDKVEETRASWRQERDRVWHDIQVKEREGEMGEDDKFRLKDELQKIVDEGNQKFEEAGRRKTAEILN